MMSFTLLSSWKLQKVSASGNSTESQANPNQNLHWASRTPYEGPPLYRKFARNWHKHKKFKNLLPFRTFKEGEKFSKKQENAMRVGGGRRRKKCRWQFMNFEIIRAECTGNLVLFANWIWFQLGVVGLIGNRSPVDSQWKIEASDRPSSTALALRRWLVFTDWES